MSRTRKQPYRKSRRFDATCRCHGSCSYCRGNRLHQQTKAQVGVRVQLQELA